MKRTTIDPFAGWKAELAKAIKEAIRSYREGGTTGMSEENLRMRVSPPRGGPTGTNARYYYANHWFPEALATLPASLRSFVLKGDAQ